MGLIMLDLDHFKLINDNFGHENGNKALKLVSGTIRDNIRRIDIPCRYGGEEFAIILPGIRLKQAIRAAERLRVSMENNPLLINGELIRLTASFGVDSYESDENIPGKGFIERTDEFLLEAKQNGRNRVCHHEGKAVEEMTEVTNKERESLMFTQFNRD
jgi:diguanylate cyclase (GGDEF)-like protein